MANILVIRTSSFGDVALLAPVVYSVAARYPQDRFTVMTRQAFAPIFEHLGFNVSVLPLDMGKRHCGALGLFKIVCKAYAGRFTHVADTHDVLRSKVIRWSLRLSFSKIAKIDKGREEKDRMVTTKVTNPFLKHTTQRYLDVFEKLGFKAEISFKNLYDFKPRVFSQLSKIVTEKQGTWIGIAPFAKHRGKIYPVEKMEKVVEMLSQRENTSLFLFGAGQEELKVIKKWTKKYPNIIKHQGLLNLNRELLLISYLDVMITMDSANMHLASLVGVPVVSVWGATHPALGFYGFEQDIDNAIGLDLNCRPCSVYGNIPCQYNGEGQYKCMKQISEQSIVNKVEQILEKKKNETSVTDPILSL